MWLWKREQCAPFIQIFECPEGLNVFNILCVQYDFKGWGEKNERLRILRRLSNIYAVIRSFSQLTHGVAPEAMSAT